MFLRFGQLIKKSLEDLKMTDELIISSEIKEIKEIKDNKEVKEVKEVKEPKKATRKKPPEKVVNHFLDFSRLGIKKCPKCGDKRHTLNGETICPGNHLNCPFL